MHRRAILGALATTALAGSGCLVREPVESSNSPTTDSESTTLTADSITADFRVDTGQEPTDDTASATRDDSVVVTGTMDPTGCNRPALDTARYSETDAVIHLAIGVTDPYPDREVECGNASYRYTCQCVVDGGVPEAVEVLHNYSGRDTTSFNIRLA